MANIITGSDNAVKVLREVVRKGIAPTRLVTSRAPHKKQQLLLGVYRPAGGGGSEYNGYFKIIAVPVVDDEGQPTGQVKIRIVDGATYNAETGKSGDSVCKVNNMKFKVPSFEKEIALKNGLTSLPVIHFTPTTSEEDDTPKVEIIDLTQLDEPKSELPEDDSENCWHQIGRVYSADGALTIYQDSIGTPFIPWFTYCGSEDTEQGDENA